MARIVQQTRIELMDREVLALDCIGDETLACRSGELWITVDGSQEDIILGPGQCWRVTGGRPVVVSALKPSILVTRHPCGRTLRNRPRGRAEWLATALARWRPGQRLAGFQAALAH